MASVEGGDEGGENLDLRHGPFAGLAHTLLKAAGQTLAAEIPAMRQSQPFPALTGWANSWRTYGA
ncbi:MAG TPA: hypothetical protein VHE23_00275 [Candidatus Acidoferrales bacterium]|nr:hypothetical protein [Candidatus Acidoferrales bacterium]